MPCILNHICCVWLDCHCWQSFLTRLHLFSFVFPSTFFVFLPHNICICVSLYLYLRPLRLVNAPHYFWILRSKLFLTKFSDFIINVWASPHRIPHPSVYKATKLKRNFWSVTHCSELGRRLMLRQAVSHKLHKLKPNLLPPPSNSTNSSALSHFCTLPNTNTNTGQHKNPKSLMTSSR